MAPEVLHRVLFATTTPSHSQTAPLTIRPAILSGYTRHRVAGCDYPAIIPDCSSPSACVRGTYVQGLTKDDQFRLDVFEGDEYERTVVKCHVLSMDGRQSEGKPAVGETYVWKEGEDALEKGEWDFEVFTREKMAGWVGGKEFLVVDEAVAAREAARSMELERKSMVKPEVEEEVLKSVV